MPKLLRLLAVFVLALAFRVDAAFEEGRHYLEVPFPQSVETGNRIEVREFFWYGCPHCHTLEPVLERWLRNKPKNVEFVRTHWTIPRTLVQAQAFYAFQDMGALDKLHSALFRAIHTDGQQLNDEASIAQFVAKQGLDPAKFRAAFNSFGVRLNVEKAKRLNEVYRIESVPTIVIDGKYMTSAGMAGGEQALPKVLDQLIQKAVQARKR